MPSRCCLTLFCHPRTGVEAPAYLDGTLPGELMLMVERKCRTCLLTATVLHLHTCIPPTLLPAAPQVTMAGTPLAWAPTPERLTW